MNEYLIIEKHDYIFPKIKLSVQTTLSYCSLRVLWINTLFQYQQTEIERINFYQRKLLLFCNNL